MAGGRHLVSKVLGAMMKESKTDVTAGISHARIVSLAIVSAVLLWLILTRSLAASLATSNPTFALRLQPAEPSALLTLAKAEFDALMADTSPPDAPGVEAQNPPDRISSLSRLAEIALSVRDSLPPKLGEPAAAPPSPRPPDVETARRLRAATPEQVSRITGLAAAVVAADPLNADALGILAQLSELKGDSKTGALMQAAARLSVRESYAHYWLLQEARRTGDDTSVLRQADTLLRTRPRSLPLILADLGRIAESSDGAQNLGAMLAADPPWRQSFLAKLPSAITDARTPLHLLLSLQSSPNPPTQAEISRYIDFLMAKKFHELAYYTWLQFLPPEQFARLTPLNNAGFDGPLNGEIFNWKFLQGQGITTEIRPRSDQTDGKALFVEFTQGRAEFPGVMQTVLLGPGNYTLTGNFKGSLVGQRGLIWRVNCVGQKPLSQTDMMRGDIPNWRVFELTFTIPTHGCRAQEVMLVLDARSASERLVIGSMWFDDLVLRRAQP